MTHPTPADPNNGCDPAPGKPSGPLNPSPTAELSSLAAQLRSLTTRLDDLDTRTAELLDALTDRVLPHLAQLHTTTADHTTQLQQLRDTIPTHETAPLDWAGMDAHQAATAWQDLAYWIEHTLVPWHQITRDQLPDCWALHPPAVIELGWLQHTHRAAHHPNAGPHLTAEWHTRWKPAALQAIHNAIPRRGTRTCGPGHHLTAPSERLQHHPAAARPSSVPVNPVTAPAEQLAQRRHWQDFYERAVSADLAKRDAD